MKWEMYMSKNVIVLRDKMRLGKIEKCHDLDQKDSILLKNFLQSILNSNHDYITLVSGTQKTDSKFSLKEERRQQHRSAIFNRCAARITKMCDI